MRLLVKNNLKWPMPENAILIKNNLQIDQRLDVDIFVTDLGQCLEIHIFPTEIPKSRLFLYLPKIFFPQLIDKDKKVCQKCD